MISQALHDHLTAWLAWAESGAPDHEHFSKSIGLCSTCSDFPDIIDELYSLLDRDFPGKDDTNSYWIAIYPFETPLEYCSAFATHLNPKRRAWVRKILQEPCQPADNQPPTG